MAEFKQRLVRAKKQVMALKKQAADAAEERDAARSELAALRDSHPAGVHAASLNSCTVPKFATYIMQTRRGRP